MRFRGKIGRIVGSAYHSALLLDPELAEAAEKLPKSKYPPPFRFDSVMHRLTDMADIAYKTAVAQGRGDPTSVSLPRPWTASDELSAEKKRAYFSHIHSKAMPRRTSGARQ